MKPSTSFFTRIGTWPTDACRTRARSTTAGSVNSAGDSSTIGTTCGGFTGCATRQRLRPGTWSAKRDVWIVDVELARMHEGFAAASSCENTTRFTSSRSDVFSCT